MTGTALILGASGHFGAHAERAFEFAGWTTRRYSRGTDMSQAARGVDIIVNGLNPPNYHAWDRLIPEITSTVLAAAAGSGATVLVPGNVYVFGRQPAPWSETTPQVPVARKGRIRAEMEARYRAAAESGVRTILLRAGDFIDPDRPDTLFDRFVIGRASRGVITAFGEPGATHAWAYLPDMARAAADLAARRETLAGFEDVPFPGLAASVTEIAAEAALLTGRQMRIRRFPWWLMRAASPFWELARELTEMRYLNDHPHWLDAGKFDRLLPDFRLAPLPAVLRRCLGQRDIDPDQPVA